MELDQIVNHLQVVRMVVKQEEPREVVIRATKLLDIRRPGHKRQSGQSSRLETKPKLGTKITAIMVGKKTMGMIW